MNPSVYHQHHQHLSNSYLKYMLYHLHCMFQQPYCSAGAILQWVSLPFKYW